MRNKVIFGGLVIAVSVLAWGGTVFAVAKKPVAVKTAPVAKIKIAAWIPYWSDTNGTIEAAANIKKIYEVSPFSLDVQPDGTIKDRLKLSEDPWPLFLATTTVKKIRVVPTIFWGKGEEMHAILSSKTKRAAHIKNIVALAASSTFSGVDIDYEAKLSETKPYFSVFLKELAGQKIFKKKLLVCTVESRTPPADKFGEDNIPKDLEYANDYKAIARYCDQVRIMAYDQREVDLKLHRAKGGDTLYRPVADPVWVAKVVAETARTIPRKKIWLGIPTYGYEWEVTKNSSCDWEYRKLRSVTYKTALETAVQYGVVPAGNASGEQSFTYQKGTSTRLVWYGDHDSIAGELALVKKYSLAGAAIFKLDGLGDPRLWEVIK